MPYSDPKREKEYKTLWNKRHYKEHTEEEKRRIWGRRDKIAAWLKEYRSTLSCEICGESTTACLDFHHRNKETKIISVSMFWQKGWGIERIKTEIDKCIVVCANCHRKIHAGLIKI
ncbi:MAG TPA: hypothetical protein VLH19_00290 [Patescibacteria group bacterium]|nr:hypothetical protein [Patescibacteria group bacterium]